MVKGVIAGNFDVIHPGYIKMLKECANNCDCLIILLHSDPSIERPDKLKPILSVKERRETLMEFKSVCDVFEYTYEAQLYDLLQVGEFDVRFLGSDYLNDLSNPDIINEATVREMIAQRGPVEGEFLRQLLQQLAAPIDNTRSNYNSLITHNALYYDVIVAELFLEKKISDINKNIKNLEKRIKPPHARIASVQAEMLEDLESNKQQIEELHNLKIEDTEKLHQIEELKKQII